MKTEVIDNLINDLQSLKDNKGEGISIDDIDTLFADVTEEQREILYQGIRQLSHIITIAKSEIVSIGETSFEDANQQLQSIVQHTEDSANTIMDCAESLQEIAGEVENEAVAEKIGNEVIKIFEASNFQDITGQRVTKVIGTLLHVEEHVSKLMQFISGEKVDFEEYESLKMDDRPDADLMNGPQLEGDGPSQDDIDALFN